MAAHIEPESSSERGFTIATGYGAMKEATFRIGHMGDHTLDRLELLLEILEDVFGVKKRARKS